MYVRGQSHKSGGRRGIRTFLQMLIALLCVGNRTIAGAGDLGAARQALATGRYDQCITLARESLDSRENVEESATLLTGALMIKGRYPEALAAATNALTTETHSLRLRWNARQALLASGQAAAADEIIAEIQQLFTTRYWLYRNARDLVIFGQVALAAGTEPKLVLDRIFEAAKKADPKSPEPYLASGDLALDKHDFALAARFFQDGLKQIPDNPDLLFGLAEAYAPSDQRLMLDYLASALELNSNHLGCLLLLADHKIDAEAYQEAEDLLARVDAVNPTHPEAWAYRAAIAHLQNQPNAEAEARARALKYWPTNPRVDHLIGLKLSQKYRFAEGAAFQRRALAFSPDYLPAKSELAEDLLRLGEEPEGWRLAEEVRRTDAYDVAANNMATLHDVLARFQTLTNAHFLLRMHPREAALYGSRALDLLEQARTTLCPAYGVEFTKPVLVEIFNEEKDFAVRTFGMPENYGFLGVCFGHVITANSPAARPGSRFNWESMLWHEFCHVVTLQLTRNKMPRWLSEGISVYEERQANKAWGEHLNPQYREMLLGGDLARISKLSGAFLAPKSPLHLQFAYYQSSLVVEFIVQRFGRDHLLAILHDLGQGMEINEALATHTLPMADLEAEFETFARDTANNMAPDADLEKPPPDQFALTPASRPENADSSAEIPASTWDLWAKTRPTNYWVLLEHADTLVDQKHWAEARPLLEKVVRLYPGATGPASPYLPLALTLRELGDTNAEIQTLTTFAAQDDQALEAYLRLMNLASTTSDWATVITNAQRYLAVNPLVPAPYRFLAQASEATGDILTAIQGWRALLRLDPPNPADIHFHLAKLLHQQKDPEALRHLLQSLEEAPRFREALLLLRQMREGLPPEPKNPDLSRRPSPTQSSLPRS